MSLKLTTSKMTKVACFSIMFVLVFGQIKNESVFRFANVFGSHMVLQQAPKRASIWGYGEVGQEVVVVFSGDIYRSFISEKTKGGQSVGIWTVMFTPTTFGGPYRIEAHSTVNGTATTIALDDVMFGDVWVCSGQSNMQFTLAMSDNGAKPINKSAHYHNIRIFTAGCDCATTPQLELKNVSLPWSRPSPETLSGRAWSYFSAVCWYYGIQLYEELRYPIGLVATTYGGTPVEAWSSPDALTNCGIKKPAKIVDNRKFKSPPREPSCLWNAMIVPFLSMTIYGAIWYQGEENALRPFYAYNCTFPAMIDDWRAKWYLSTQHNTDPMFPFGFVQLSVVGPDYKGFPGIRWDQTVNYGYVPNDRQKSVFMAVAMDLGSPEAPYGNIHPTDKITVGYRLALGGLAIGYGVETYYTGPLVSTIKKQTQPPSVALQVTFKSLNGEIEVRSNSGFEVYCENSARWVDAPIVNYGPEFVIIMPISGDCVAGKVRYAWSAYPCPKLKCAIYSKGLPSPPFIMDGPYEVKQSSSL